MKSYIVYKHTYNFNNGTKTTSCLYNGTIETRAKNTYRSAVESAKNEQTRIDIELVVLDNVNYGGWVYTNGFIEKSRKAKRKQGLEKGF